MFSLPTAFLRVCWANTEHESASRGWAAPRRDVCADMAAVGPGYR